MVAIQKYIESHWRVEPVPGEGRALVTSACKAMEDRGDLVKVRKSYKLSSAANARIKSSEQPSGARTRISRPAAPAPPPMPPVDMETEYGAGARSWRPPVPTDAVPNCPPAQVGDVVMVSQFLHTFSAVLGLESEPPTADVLASMAL